MRTPPPNLPLAAARERRGIALVTALLTLVLITSMAAAMFSSARADLRDAKTERGGTLARRASEAASVVAEQVLLNALANSLPIPEEGVAEIGEDLVPYTIAAIGRDFASVDEDGVRTLHTHYRIDTDAEVRGHRRVLHRSVEVGLTPIFQYAIFYDRDLELLPGPSMTLSGRVHSNQDLYVGVGDGATLTVDSHYFRCVGDLLRRRKDGSGAATGGSVRMLRSGSSTYQSLWSAAELRAEGVPSVSGFDSSFTGFDADGDGDLDDRGDWPDFTVGALSTWNGTVQTGAHGVRRVEPPSIGSIKRYEEVGAGLGDHVYDEATGEWREVLPGTGTHREGRYFGEADLRVVDGEAVDALGNPVFLPSGTITEKSFYDARERRTTKVTEIDLKKLRESGQFPLNGLLYAARTDSAPGASNGIRLVNGAELGGPLTVVSENPVYVKGDYNTVNKKPASVMADTVNLLSNSWDDTKRAGSLPKARATTYNLAMITGAGETSGSDYSGGFENLPRFHENWSSVACNIAGSFVKIYGSEQATGSWRYGGDVYTAPQRNWDYDQDFDDIGKLPPFTPNVAQVTGVAWWE